MMGSGNIRPRHNGYSVYTHGKNPENAVVNTATVECTLLHSHDLTRTESSKLIDTFSFIYTAHLLQSNAVKWEGERQIIT